MTEPIQNLVVPGNETHWLLSTKSVAYVPIKNAMPCITILVHGVNDVGEAYPYQEKGLCKGLNNRLCRTDIQSGEWSLPPEKKKDEKFTADDVNPDPDKIYFQRKPDGGTSLVIPFYWGFREDADFADTTQRHGQYLDRYGNRIDKRYGKNGGAFANATTNIPDMFGPGFDANWKVRLADPEGATHPIYTAPPRTYMVLAAQRLATLIRIIRAKSPHEPINIIAHSQGCFVTLLAHAFLAKEGAGIKADTVVMNNPPYSVEEPFLERFAQTGYEQQTSHAREETLRQIIAEYMTQAPATTPEFATLKSDGDGAVGRLWEPSARKERDNRGKVYLYFSPDDATVGLPNIQGIGWWGVYNAMREKLGPRFFQRMFASPTGSNPKAPTVGAEPQKYDLHFKWNSGFTMPRERFISGESLEAAFKADLGDAELRNGPIDAAIASTNTYNKKHKEGILPDETPEQAQARWLNLDDANSYHSSIVSNPEHTEKATAYDVSIGVSSILKDNNLDWMRFLRAAADWRTNWFGSAGGPVSNKKDPSFPPPPPEIAGMLDSAIASKDREIIVGNYNYYCMSGSKPGELPQFTSSCKVESLNPYVVSQTIRQSIRERNEYRHESQH